MIWSHKTAADYALACPSGSTITVQHPLSLATHLPKFRNDGWLICIQISHFHQKSKHLWWSNGHDFRLSYRQSAGDRGSTPRQRVTSVNSCPWALLRHHEYFFLFQYRFRFILIPFFLFCMLLSMVCALSEWQAKALRPSEIKAVCWLVWAGT